MNYDQCYPIAQDDDVICEEIIDSSTGEHGDLKESDNSGHNSLGKIIDQHTISKPSKKVSDRTAAVVNQEMDESDGNNNPDYVVQESKKW